MIGIFFVQTFIIRRVMENLPHDELSRTPLLSSIFQASALLVLITWLFKVIWKTSHLAFLNLFFISGFIISMYHFFRTTLNDPGYLRLPNSDEEKKRVVLELVEKEQFDTRHYCLACFVRIIPFQFLSFFDPLKQSVLPKFHLIMN